MKEQTRSRASRAPARSLALGLLCLALAVAGWSAIVSWGRWPCWVLALSETALTTFHLSAWRVQRARSRQKSPASGLCG
ncbi:hypothetical protein [Kineococcus sp. SYSU DK005]|uniref:hypothetical protein n=1 Tax=Kineococcus sp. SYSU DK005 TaxID=3383126 RepID=UPI003D7D93DC